MTQSVPRHATERGGTFANAGSRILGAQEKLTLAMMEVNARAERLEHSQAQVSAARGEIRSLENQLAIATNTLTLTQQQNAALAQTDAQRTSQLQSVQVASPLGTRPGGPQAPQIPDPQIPDNRTDP